MIRRASAQDAAAVARLLGELGYPADAEAVARRLEALATDDDAVLLADDGAGVLSMHRVPRLAEEEPFARITTLVVAARHGGKGIGRALLEAAEAAARDWGATMLEISCGRRPDRERAHRIYAAAGFTDSTPHSAVYRKPLG